MPSTKSPDGKAESERTPAPEGLDLARLCARLASDRRATDVVLLDLGDLSPVTSYFVVATGRSTRQIGGIADEIVRTVKHQGRLPFGVEGRGEARWVLIDLSEVVVHLMSEDARNFYDLEMLWGDAEKIAWE